MSTSLAAHTGSIPRTLVYHRDLILVLLAKELKVRYKSTFVGYAWSVMHPLVLALVFFMLFRVVLRLEIPAYALYLIAGLFPWQWMANVTGAANFYFLGNSPLIKKVRFERSTLVLAGVLNETVHFLVSLPVIVGFMLYYGHAPRVSWLWTVPALLVVQFAMTFGVGLLVATSNLFFRDLERLVALAMNLLFYVTPIVYLPEQIPQGYQWALFANPFASLVMCWHGVFYGDAVPGLFFGVAMSWAAALLAMGYLAYAKNVWRFAEFV